MLHILSVFIDKYGENNQKRFLIQNKITFLAIYVETVWKSVKNFDL